MPVEMMRAEAGATATLAMMEDSAKTETIKAATEMAETETQMETAQTVTMEAEMETVGAETALPHTTHPTNLPRAGYVHIASSTSRSPASKVLRFADVLDFAPETG